MTVVVRPTVPPTVRALVFFFAIILSAPRASAQLPVPIATHVGTERGERLGLTTAIVGDLNRDGCADYLIGAPGASPDGVDFAGSAFLYSGASGSLLRRIDGNQSAEQRGLVAALGDVDGDSIPDYAVAAPLVPNGGFLLAGSIWVISGKTHQTLYDLRGPTERAKFGTMMTGIGDADGDGLADIAIGAWPTDLNGLVEVGVVYVVRGQDGALIRSFNGQFEGQRFGYSVSGVGDLDGDGLADIAIGAPAVVPRNGRGSIRILSPKSGHVLWSLVSDQDGDAMGFLVAGMGDLDGGGTPDWLASAPWRSVNDLTANGAAWAFSGESGLPLFEVDGARDGDHWGSSLAAAGLMNNDVTPDFAVGSPDVASGAYRFGAATIYSGVDGAPILQVGPDPAIVGEASWMAGGDDVDGDGNDDLIVSASLFSYGSSSAGYQAGRADVFSYSASRVPALVDLIPGLCPNVLPSDPDALLTLNLLGGPGFDVSQIVPESIRLGGMASASPASPPVDVAGAPSQSDPCECGETGPDGIPDRVFQFRRGDLTAVLGSPGPRGYVLKVTGRFQNGVRLEGTVCVSGSGRAPFVAPNPIRRGGEAAVFVDIPREGAPVQIEVFDVRGRLVRNLAHKRMDAGTYRIPWNGRRDDGVQAAGGIYFVKMRVGSSVRTSRVVLVP